VRDSLLREGQNANARVFRALNRASAHYKPRKSRYATAAAADNANHRKGLSRAASINHRAPVLIVLSTKEAPAGCGLRVPPLPRLNGAVPRRFFLRILASPFLFSSSLSLSLSLSLCFALTVCSPRAPWCHRCVPLCIWRWLCRGYKGP